MLFSGDDVLKRTSVPSGGERGRLALAKVLVHRTNCLLLDEPTNNLDIIAKDTLLEALKRFPGTVAIVSHDRHVLNQLVTEVIEVGKGHAIRYLGNYDDYLRKKAEIEAPAARPVRKETESRSDASNGPARHLGRIPGRDGKQRQQREAKRRAAIEAKIETHETERARLSEEMNDPDFYLKRADANELIARYERLAKDIERLYAELMKFDEELSA
jgi:ATP-binding cassette subfamily F protein 3